MEREAVALVQCPDYQEEKVYLAIRQAVDLLGGIGRFVRPEEKILLKPNLLKKATPEQGVTTHPSVLAGTIRLLQEAGCTQLTYGDSPGMQSMESVARTAGLAAVAEKAGVAPADFANSQILRQDGLSFPVCCGVLSADGVINLPKMKTHALERITGGVKNLYGCVAGLHKAAGHTRFPDAVSFAGMLVTLAQAIRPRLTIMDGIVAMEGNGPGSGDPVAMKVILAAADPFALDQVFCLLIGLAPLLVPTNAQGGLRTLEILTPGGEITPEEAFARYGNASFRVHRQQDLRLNNKAADWFLQRLQPKPVILQDQCRSCGICAESCPLPQKAISMAGKYPKYHYNRCIRCYCCQEMCPHHAITVVRPRLGRLLSRSGKKSG